MPRLFTAVCATALVFAAAAPSVAEERRSELVRFSDLDLDQVYDADRLIDRVQAAAARVCGAHAGVQPLAQWHAGLECAAETAELTVRDLGHPMVLARYYGVHPRVIIEEGSADPRYEDYVIVSKRKK